MYIWGIHKNKILRSIPTENTWETDDVYNSGVLCDYNLCVYCIYTRTIVYLCGKISLSCCSFLPLFFYFLFCFLLCSSVWPFNFFVSFQIKKKKRTMQFWKKKRSLRRKGTRNLRSNFIKHRREGYFFTRNKSKRKATS